MLKAQRENLRTTQKRHQMRASSSPSHRIGMSGVSCRLTWWAPQINTSIASYERLSRRQLYNVAVRQTVCIAIWRERCAPCVVDRRDYARCDLCNRRNCFGLVFIADRDLPIRTHLIGGCECMICIPCIDNEFGGHASAHAEWQDELLTMHLY